MRSPASAFYSVLYIRPCLGNPQYSSLITSYCTLEYFQYFSLILFRDELGGMVEVVRLLDHGRLLVADPSRPTEPAAWYQPWGRKAAKLRRDWQGRYYSKRSSTHCTPSLLGEPHPLLLSVVFRQHAASSCVGAVLSLPYKFHVDTCTIPDAAGLTVTSLGATAGRSGGGAAQLLETCTLLFYKAPHCAALTTVTDGWLPRRGCLRINASAYWG